MKEPLHTELLLFLYVSHIVIVNNFEFKYPLEHAWNVEEGRRRDEESGHGCDDEGMEIESEFFSLSVR